MPTTTRVLLLSAGLASTLASARPRLLPVEHSSDCTLLGMSREELTLELERQRDNESSAATGRRLVLMGVPSALLGVVALGVAAQPKGVNLLKDQGLRDTVGIIGFGAMATGLVMLTIGLVKLVISNARATANVGNSDALQRQLEVLPPPPSVLRPAAPALQVATS